MAHLLSTTTMLAISLAAADAGADQQYKAWFKFFVGEWTYEWVAEEGEFEEKGELKIGRAAGGKALIIRITTEDGDKEVEISGWQPEKKAFVFLGYSSNGGYWTGQYTDIQARKMTGSGNGRLPDGKAWKGKMTLTKKGDDCYQIRIEGSANDEKLVTVGTFTRRKAPK